MTSTQAYRWALDAMSNGYSYSFCIWTIETNMPVQDSVRAKHLLHAALDIYSSFKFR